jgi:hypothetical protein
VWAALGLVYVWESLGLLFGRERVVVGTETFELPTTRSWLLASPILLLAVVPLIGNWQASSRAGETDTADFAIDMLNSVEPYGILVTVGDNDTFPLWYAQEVLGVRKDVTVANTSLLNTEWYTRQIIRREVFPYDAERGPALYRGREWPQPSGSALKMSMEDANRIPLMQPMSSRQVFTKGDIRAVLEPRMLSRADILVLRMLLDNDERRVHFSRTSVDLAEDLGLGAYAVMQGHTRRVMPQAVVEGGDIVRLPGAGFVDVAASVSLWREFKAPASLIAKGDWIDNPSRGIPFLIVDTGIATAEAATRAGMRGVADSIMATAQDVASAAGFGNIFGPSAPTLPQLPFGDTLVRTPVPGPGRP